MSPYVYIPPKAYTSTPNLWLNIPATKPAQTLNPQTPNPSTAQETLVLQL